MKFLLLLLSFAIPCLAADWALTDPTLGWNKQGFAVRYHDNSKLQTLWAYSAIGKNPPAPADRVLDLGSGDGKITALLAQMAYEGEVVGIDIAGEMVMFAQQMYPLPNLSFLHSDRITFSPEQVEGKFDLVTSFCVFHLVPHPQETLQGVRQVLTPRGKLVAVWPVRARPEFYQAVKEEMALRGWSLPPPTAESKRMRDPEQIPVLIEGAGFEIERFEVVESRIMFPSEEKLLDWLANTCGAQWEIPDDERDAYFADFTRRYLEYAPDERHENGCVSFTLTQAEVVARPISIGAESGRF